MPPLQMLARFVLGDAAVSEVTTADVFIAGPITPRVLVRAPFATQGT